MLVAGRARLRRSLYTAALPATFQWNKGLGALYAQLMARGKNHKCAMWPVLANCWYANTVVQRSTPWQERCGSKA